MNIQFKGHFVSFGYSERIYVLCESDFFYYCPMGNTINWEFFFISLTNIFLFPMQCAKIYEFVHRCNVSRYLTPETQTVLTRKISRK